MARHFTVTLTSGTNNGPYTIYHTSSTNGNQALLYGTTNQATGLTLAQVQGGVLITVPDNATSVIFYNNNATMISDCPTNIVEYPLSPSGTPTPSPTPSSSSVPNASPTPSSSPAPNASPTPSPTPSSSPAPNASPTPSPTPTPTASSTPTPTPSPSSSPTPTPSPTPSALPYSTFFRSTVKSNLGSDDIVDEYGNPGGFCDNNYLVNTRFYVGGANRNLHSSLESQNVYTDSNLTNPLPNGYYYCSLSSEESGGFTYSATPGDTHKYIEVQFGNGTVTTGVHNCSSAPGGGGNN